MCLCAHLKVFVFLMCQRDVFVMCCVLCCYGVFCWCCLLVCYAFAYVACGVLCDVVWIAFVGFGCVGVMLICLCGVFMVYCVMSYGSCWCCCECVRAGLNVFVRFACDLTCDVV